MNKKEEKTRKEEFRGMRANWIVAVVGTFTAAFLGVAVNAFYDLLRLLWSPLMIFIFFGGFSIFSVGLFTYMFEHLEEIRKNPKLTAWGLGKMYVKSFFNQK